MEVPNSNANGNEQNASHNVNSAQNTIAHQVVAQQNHNSNTGVPQQPLASNSPAPQVNIAGLGSSINNQNNALNGSATGLLPCEWVGCDYRSPNPEDLYVR